MTPADPATGTRIDPSPRTLEAVVAELRRLAVAALDAGHPVVAARIAGTADQIEAETWPLRPPRPDYEKPPTG